MNGVRVTRSLVIPDEELELSFTPSGGPGGQHANKTSTRVVLAWNVDRSRALGPRQRDRIKRNLGGRLDSRGYLRLSASAHRSQLRNREEVERRLGALVAAALRPQRARRPTEPTPASRERRIRAKKRRSDIKKLRSPPVPE